MAQEKTSKLMMYAIFGVPLLIGGFFLYKFIKSKNATDENTNPPLKNDTPKKNDGGGSSSGDYEKYIVATNKKPLNIRKSPSTSANILGDLSKGTSIMAKPSSTSGWMEYSEDGKTTYGFVSSQYVRKA